jgi:hypothetical protein
VKLMKSSTFSYEQAWHRLVALYTTKPGIFNCIKKYYFCVLQYALHEYYKDCFDIFLICIIQNLQIN